MPDTKRLALIAAQREALARNIELELDAARRELERAAPAVEERAAALEALRASEKRQRELIAEHRARVRELQQLNSTLSLTLNEVQRDVERASASRAWRWGHFLTTLAWRVRRRPVRTEGALAAAAARIARAQTLAGSPSLAAPEPSSSRRRPSIADERRVPLPLSVQDEAAIRTYRTALAIRLRDAFGPVPERTSWPSVTAIIVSRNGRLHLERLFAGLIECTDYAPLEVIVVDNGSSDGSVEYLAGLTTPFQLRVIAIGEDLSFAEANDRGAAEAGGELLLFLNNDIEPFEAGWLRELVAALDTDLIDAVGATLLHSEPRGILTDTEPLVQHRAIAMHWEDGTVRGYNLGDGEWLWDGSFGIERRCVAVTAACLLIGRSTFDGVGGFETDYRFGTEDVDLGLKLVSRGAQLAGVGRSVLVHRESSTQNRTDRSVRQINRTANRRVLLERWGPSLLRAYRLGRLRRDLLWTDGRGPHIAITVTNLDPAAGWGDWYTAHELGGALESLGWRVTYVQRKGDEWYSLPDDLEYLLALMDPYDLGKVPEHVTVIAWIRNWTERWLGRPWFDRIDVVLASSMGSAELIKQVSGMAAIRFPLATNPARFFGTSRSPELASDFVYTGNRWGEERAIERAVAPRNGEQFRVFGSGWENVKRMRPYHEGSIDYETLPSVYASAKLVLDDTQSPTLPYGAVNGRVFDALAAGALPVTDCEAGVRELFDDDFPVWNSADSLRARLDELLDDEQTRDKLVRRYRQVVLRHHTYERRAHDLRQILIDHEHKLTFAIKIGAPDRGAAERWGDLHFAQSLSRELRRRGHRTMTQTLDEWDEEEGLRRDVVLHLKGLTRYHPKPGQLNVLWSISHPAELTGEECDGFDLVCVASPQFAQRLRTLTSTPVVVLEQATDPRVFKPDPRADLTHELAYVANSRNVLRPMMRDLLPTKRDLAVWGANWKGLIPDHYVVADHLPNDQLRHVYSSAQIVLCDHWDDMRTSGYISNRIYDALACGAFVLSDDVVGLRDRFGDSVVTYRTRDELDHLIDRFLRDPDERRRRAAIGRQTVLASHTFAQTVDILMREVGSAAGLGPPSG